MLQEQLFQAHGHGFSQDLLAHPRGELIARGEILHLVQMQGVVGDPRQLRVVQRPDQAGNVPSDVA